MISDGGQAPTDSLSLTVLGVAWAVCPAATILLSWSYLRSMARTKELDWGSWRPWRPAAGKGEPRGSGAVFTGLSAVRSNTGHRSDHTEA